MSTDHIDRQLVFLFIAKSSNNVKEAMKALDLLIYWGTWLVGKVHVCMRIIWISDRLILCELWLWILWCKWKLKCLTSDSGSLSNDFIDLSWYSSLNRFWRELYFLSSHFRADYWKSNPRKFCDFCKCWFADNKAVSNSRERQRLRWRSTTT